MTFNNLLRGITVAVIAATAFAADAVNPKPFTVPEIRQWRGAEGNFEIAPDARVTYSDPKLQAIAQRFAQDYTSFTGRQLNVEKAKARKGDINFKIKPSTKAKSESYNIDITDRVTVTAPAEEGARWGAMTLLQMLEQAPALPKGQISDQPSYGFRGFMIDAGRKYIPLDYLYKLVDVMAYYKLNELNVHLNDNGFVYFYDDDLNMTQAAFRLESETFPGLTARDGFYTKNEFRDFQKYAAGRGVEIIPEFDLPAHSLAFSHYRPSLGSKEYGIDHLNLMSEETYGFVDSLFAEYLGGPDPVFIGKRFNIGTDEYSNKDSVVVEKFRYFTDRYARQAMDYGKRPVAWGALTHAKGKFPVVVDGLDLFIWYNGYAEPKEMHELGYNMVSIPDNMVYIVPKAKYYQDYLNNRRIYDNWAPNVFRDVVFDENDPQVLGGMFAVWNDHSTNGVTVKDIHHRVMHSLPTIAAKTWSGSSVTVPFEEFEKKSAMLSEAPGVNYLSTFGHDPITVLEVAEVKAGQELPIKEIGYDYTVEFDVDGAKESKGTVLFESPDATFWLCNPVNGTMGYSREDKIYLLRYDVRPGEKIHVKIEGDNDALRFYVNGKLVDNNVSRYLRHNDNDMQIAELRTLVFPLAKAGNYKSKISNLKVRNYIEK